jgi:protein TonB
MLIKDFDLLSPKWLDIAFEKKNKQYGAYELRNDSSNRHLKALIIVFIVGLAAVFLPKIVSSIEWGEPAVKEESGITMVDLNTDNPDEIEPQTPVDIPPPPPIEMKASVQFTDAVIKKDDDVREENLQQAQNVLADLDETIAASTQQGKTDGSGVNPDDVQRQNAIVVPKDTVYKFVEKMPEFPGGSAALTKWLNDNINYPYIAQENGIQGKVYVNFIVRPDGRIDGVKIAKSVHQSLDKEAMRLVSAMPKWMPGRQNGNPVSAYYTLPVTFILK